MVLFVACSSIPLLRSLLNTPYMTEPPLHMLVLSRHLDGQASRCTYPATVSSSPLSSCSPVVQSADFKGVMQQLLPAEQAASKPAPKEPSSISNQAPKGSPHGDKQQAQRASSAARASDPKRQDQPATKPAGPKSSDKDKGKDKQEPDKSHSARRDAGRSHPVGLLLRLSACRRQALCTSFPGRMTLSQEALSQATVMEDCVVSRRLPLLRG